MKQLFIRLVEVYAKKSAKKAGARPESIRVSFAYAGSILVILLLRQGPDL
jgi:hypothetical protein